MRDAQTVLQAERTSLADTVAKRDQDVARTAAEVCVGVRRHRRRRPSNPVVHPSAVLSCGLC